MSYSYTYVIKLSLSHNFICSLVKFTVLMPVDGTARGRVLALLRTTTASVILYTAIQCGHGLVNCGRIGGIAGISSA